MPATDDNTLLPFSLPSIGQKKVTGAFDGGRISSDGVVLLLAGADQRRGLIALLAALHPVPRAPQLRPPTTPTIPTGSASAVPADRCALPDSARAPPQ